MITKGLIILVVGVIGTITTIVLWLIALFKAPEDIKTYFIYDNEGEITMINKGVYKTSGSETTLADGTATEVIEDKIARTEHIVHNAQMSKSKEETVTEPQVIEKNICEITEVEVAEGEVIEVESTIFEDTLIGDYSEKKEIDETEIEK